MAKTKKIKSPTQLELVEPTFSALVELGGSATVDEIREKVIELLKLPDEIVDEPHKGNASQQTELDYQLAWARTRLKNYGAIANSKRGVWMITPEFADKSSISRSEITEHLKEVAKQYRKLNRKGMPAEITLIGGASILINYGFRDSTYDVDALIQASSSMKDAINYVTDTMGLPNGWLNDDFRNTTSYTPRLVAYSRHYRTFSNVVNIRTIAGEYLVAMKLRAFRQYMHDISDIVGILREHIRTGDPLTYERIDKAVHDLYDGWEHMPENAHSMIQSILADEDMDALYEVYAQEESAAKDALLTFDDKYPDVLKEDNLSDILSHLMAKQKEAAESE